MSLEQLKKEVIKLISNTENEEKLLQTRDLFKTKIDLNENINFTKENIDVIFPHVKESTRISYFSFLKKFTPKQLLDTQYTITEIENYTVNIGTRKKYYAIINAYFTNTQKNDSIKEIYYKEYDKYCLKIDNSPQKELKINYDDLYEKIFSIKEKDYNCFVALYMQLQYPLRSDFKSVKIRNYNKSTDNYLDLQKNTLVFNKRTKKDDFITFDISEDLQHIRDYINTILEDEDREYLFVNTQGNRIESDYSKFLERCCRKHKLPNLTINDFRHIYVTRFIGNSIDVEEIKRHNKKLGHSLEVALKFYVYKNKE